MSKRSTGITFENSVAQILTEHGYTVTRQNKVEMTSSRNYKIDMTVEKEGQPTFDMELKWQEVCGTTYEKLPFACARLRKVSKARNTQPLVVYGGQELMKAMVSDPILKNINNDYPDVPIMHIGDMVLNLQSKGTLV